MTYNAEIERFRAASVIRERLCRMAQRETDERERSAIVRACWVADARTEQLRAKAVDAVERADGSCAP